MHGQTERYNSTILDKLRRYVSAYQDDWDESVAAVTLAYNMTPIRSTGFSPRELCGPGIRAIAAVEARVGASEFCDSIHEVTL
jgi:hypothetical protein